MQKFTAIEVYNGMSVISWPQGRKEDLVFHEEKYSGCYNFCGKAAVFGLCGKVFVAKNSQSTTHFLEEIGLKEDQNLYVPFANGDIPASPEESSYFTRAMQG